MKTLVVYYSLGGNTRGIAQRIQKTLGADILEIEPEKPYAGPYESIVAQGEREVYSHIKPTIKSIEVNIADYDRIMVGTPTWWYTMAPVVLTFLTSNDWSGKIVVPFMTNAGWPGTVIKDMKAACKGATFCNEKEIRFHASDQRRMVTPENKVEEWIESLK
jgi:flavodoxin